MSPALRFRLIEAMAEHVAVPLADCEDCTTMPPWSREAGARLCRTPIACKQEHCRKLLDVIEREAFAFAITEMKRTS